MSLQELNTLDKSTLKVLLTKCNGSSQWVEKIAAHFPFTNEAALFQDASDTWHTCNEKDWLEAFTHHPKIGDISSLKVKFATTAAWAAGEQSAVSQSSEEVLEALATGNNLYEKKFGYIFIVCATGKSAAEMLALLTARLRHNPAEEMKVAMEEQDKITTIRLEKLLRS